MTALRFTTVGFDLDGTLLDTSADLGAALNYALSTIGRKPVPSTAVSGLIGGGSRLMLQRALGMTGGDQGVDIAALREVMLEYYADNIAVHTRLYPGGAVMLNALARSGISLAVITNKPEFLARRLLNVFDLTRYFGTIIGGGTYPLKPAPDALHAMVRQLGGGPAAFVGDTTFDICAARAAGMPVIAVSFGFNDVPPAQLGADAVIDHFDELVKILSQI